MQLKNEISEQYQEWKNVIWICLALNLLAYMECIVHMTYSIDDYSYLFSKVNHIEHGRWFSGFIFNTLLQKNFMPALSPIIAITGYILTGIGFCKLWCIPRKTSLMVIALWSLHPYLLEAYIFRISTVIIAAGYLISIASLLLVNKGKYGFISAVILFYLALSTYQVVIGFVIAVVMIQALLIVFRGSFSTESIRKSLQILFRYALMLSLSIIIYLIITKLLFVCLNLNVNSRYQSGFINNLEQLKAKICVTGTVLFVRLLPIKEFVIPFVGKLGIFVICIGAIITIIKKTPRLSIALPAVLWAALIPLAAISFTLPLETLDLPWRICMGLVVFLAGMFAISQEFGSPIIRRVCMGLALFLIALFILNNNAIIYKQYVTNQKDVMTANRMIAKAQSLEGYQPGLELAIIGKVQKENFSRIGKSNWQIITGYIKHSTVRRYSLTKGAFETDWSKYSFLLNYCDLELKRCSKIKIAEIKKLHQNKESWPHPSSVFIHDKTVVIVLSSTKK